MKNLKRAFELKGLHYLVLNIVKIEFEPSYHEPILRIIILIFLKLLEFVFFLLLKFLIG